MRWDRVSQVFHDALHLHEWFPEQMAAMVDVGAADASLYDPDASPAGMSAVRITASTFLKMCDAFLKGFGEAEAQKYLAAANHEVVNTNHLAEDVSSIVRRQRKEKEKQH